MIAVLYQRSSIGMAEPDATVGPWLGRGSQGSQRGEIYCGRAVNHAALGNRNESIAYRPWRMPRIWLSNCARPFGLSSRPATEHNRLPRRLPAPGIAVMSSTTRLRLT